MSNHGATYNKHWHCWKEKKNILSVVLYLMLLLCFAFVQHPARIDSSTLNAKPTNHLSSWRRRPTLSSERAETWSCPSVRWICRRPDETRHLPGPAVGTEANATLHSWQTEYFNCAGGNCRDLCSLNSGIIRFSGCSVRERGTGKAAATSSRVCVALRERC